MASIRTPAQSGMAITVNLAADLEVLQDLTADL